MNDEAKNEVWHSLCNAERMIRFLDSVVDKGEELTPDQASLVKKTLDEIQEAKSFFLDEE